jgi:osmotically-inducible protein OsmY
MDNLAPKEATKMTKKLGKIAAVFALIFMLGGCQAMTGRTAGQNIDDSNTTAAVKARLAQDKVSSLTRIDVDTNGGVVALNGTVESAEQRARAEQIARAVGGVKRVVNNLQVQR